MKFKNFLMIICLLSIFLFSMSIISASNDLNNTLNLDDSYSNDIYENSSNVVKVNENNDLIGVASSSKTITIVVDKSNPNQVLNPTIQPAIDDANPGDTIILKGDFVHCHFIINKTINIIASDATLGPCPHHQTEGAGSFGVFYITEGGSGSSFTGVTFNNNGRAVNPFSFLIRGASDIVIQDCTVNYPESEDYKYQSIVIENSNKIKLSNLFINDSTDGIRIINSNNVDISNCILSYNQNQAISISGSSRNININQNIIINNKNFGINLENVNYVSIINNLIKDNGLNNDDSGSGIYVNANITKLIVKGNIFISNGLHAIMYDYRVRNLNLDDGADQLTVIDNNYFEGHKSMILHHKVYIEKSYGTLKYDVENDVYGNVGVGNYVESKSYVYMQHAYIFNDVPCGFTYYTNKIPWTLDASGNGGKYDLYLRLNLKQVKNGLYSFSLVDVNGNVAKDFNSFDVIFFLNDFNTVEPRNADVYKKVSFVNGVATANFIKDYLSYKSTGNIITAVFPGGSNLVVNNPYVQLKLKDSDNPIYLDTKIIASSLTTYPLSDVYFSVKLTDYDGKIISNQKVTFLFNGKTYISKTDNQGIAKVKVSLTSKKTFKVTVSYSGNDEYKYCQVTSKIIVKTGSKKSKIKASNIKVKKNKKKLFKLKLTTDSAKALKNQKIIVKVNGKTKTIKTNNKGIAKISLKFKIAKKYNLSIKYLGNEKYKASSKKCKITVTK